MTFNIFDQIYCISLPECTDRRVHLESEMKKMGIEGYVLWDAIGKDDPQVRRAYESGFVATFPPCFRCGKRNCSCSNNILIPSQIGNFLTYREVWRDITKHQYGLCLIVEDDIKFADYAQEVAERILNKSKLESMGFSSQTTSLLRLGWAKCEDHRFDGAVSITENVVRMSNPCHAITGKMADLLYQSLDKIRTTSDLFTHQHVGAKAKNYTLFPPIAYELSWSNGEFKSQIHPKRRHIEHLRAQPDISDEIIKAEQAALKYHFKKKLIRDFLIVGSSLSGLEDMAGLFGFYGITIGVDRMRRHGIASWVFAVKDSVHPYLKDTYSGTRCHSEFGKRIHFVETPVTSALRIMLENRQNEQITEFRRKNIKKMLGIDIDHGQPEISQAITIMICWHKIISEENPDITITRQTMAEKVPELCTSELLKQEAGVQEGYSEAELSGFRPDRERNKETSNQTHMHFSADLWHCMGDGIKEELIGFCHEYGYSTL